ncbi:MAG: hypothetical protein ICV60_14485 [Pyrinomonadaceae bacterium]|nr:hypothetical protein [Pyrinomonadaceae bacterium]
MRQRFVREYLPHLVTGALLLGVLSALYTVPQVADPNFNARVAGPTYTKEHPVIIFDEGHQNFHTTGGRYKPFADLLSNDGYQILPIREKFQSGLLMGGRILVIASALGANDRGDTPAFTDDECDAVRDWVNTGGSLLLITDIYPTGAAAANLAQRFGVEMSKGFTEDPSNHVSNKPGMIIFARDKGLIGQHPITDGRTPQERINKVITYTGQSLKGPEGSAPILKLSDTAVDRVPELIETENPDGPPQQTIQYSDPVPAVGRSQGVAFKYGRGRVVVMGEAGVLSAQVQADGVFGMNDTRADNRQLTLNIIHWLSGVIEPAGH